MPRLILTAIAACALTQGCAPTQAVHEPAPSTTAITYVPYSSGQEPSGYTSSGQLAFNFENSGLFRNIDPIAATAERRARKEDPEPSLPPGDLSDEDLALLGEVDTALGTDDIDTDPRVAEILASGARREAPQSGLASSAEIGSADGVEEVDGANADPTMDALLNDPLLNIEY